MAPTLKQLQKQIEKDYARPIRLEKTKKKRPENLHKFLIKFFTEWNAEKNTIYVDTKEVQTDTGRRRSLGDIFMICKYYYPKVTLEEVVRELYVDLRKHFQKGYRTSYCYTIYKRVWYYDDNKANLDHDKLKNDEYGMPHRYYMAMLNGEKFNAKAVCGGCGEYSANCTCDDGADWEDDD